MSHHSRPQLETLERLDSPVREMAPGEAEAVRGGIVTVEYLLVGTIVALGMIGATTSSSTSTPRGTGDRDRSG